MRPGGLIKSGAQVLLLKEGRKVGVKVNIDNQSKLLIRLGWKRLSETNPLAYSAHL
jgi:hypothetical protein